MSKSILFLVLIAISPWCSVLGQTESNLSIQGDTIRISSSSLSTLKFMGEVEDARLMSTDFSVNIGGNKVTIRRTADKPSIYNTLIVDEGTKSDLRNHVFTIQYVKNTGPSDQYHDYSTKEKIRNRIAYLEGNRGPVKMGPEPMPEVEPEEAPKAAKVEKVQKEARPDKEEVEKTPPVTAGTGKVQKKRTTSEAVILQIPQNKIEAKVKSRIDNFYEACERLGKKTDLVYSLNYGMKQFNNDENVMVQRVSKKIATPRPIKIRSYFNTLAQLPYEKIEMTAKSVNFVSEFTKGPDGRWHGTAYVMQDFKGYRDGILVYEDLTEKPIDLIIVVWDETDTETMKTTQKFDIFLGNISVRSVQS